MNAPIPARTLTRDDEIRARLAAFGEMPWGRVPSLHPLEYARLALACFEQLGVPLEVQAAALELIEPHVVRCDECLGARTVEVATRDGYENRPCPRCTVEVSDE